MSSSQGLEQTVLAHETDFRLGGLRVRPSLSEVGVNGATQHLEPRVMQVLVALVRAEGEVLSRDDLVARCWDGVVVGDDAVSRIISKLRRLSKHERAGFEIETLPRIGYRLTLVSAEAATGRTFAAHLRRRVGVRRLVRRWAFLVPVVLGSVAALTVIARLAPEVRTGDPAES